MKKISFDNYELLNSFEKLKINSLVYSRKYGLGNIIKFYNEEIIVQFPNLRKRFGVDDAELRKIPESHLLKKTY